MLVGIPKPVTEFDIWCESWDFKSNIRTYVFEYLASPAAVTTILSPV